jgi:hypothetical protein
MKMGKIKNIKISIKYSVRGVTTKPEIWTFKNIDRDQPIGTKKYLYAGTLVDPIGEGRDVLVLAKGVNNARKKLKSYILRWI